MLNREKAQLHTIFTWLSSDIICKGLAVFVILYFILSMLSINLYI